MRWKPLQAVDGGYTNMAPAFREVAAAIGPDRLESRALRPALLLVTDGRPTDLGTDFADALAALTSFPAGRASLRLAVAIGREARSEHLEQFIGDPSVPVIVAGNTEEIAERLVAASIAVSRLSEAGADQGALVSQLLGSGSDHAARSDDQTSSEPMGDPVSEANGAHRWAVVTASTRGAAHEHDRPAQPGRHRWRSLDDRGCSSWRWPTATGTSATSGPSRALAARGRAALELRGGTSPDGSAPPAPRPSSSRSDATGWCRRWSTSGADWCRPTSRSTRSTRTRRRVRAAGPDSPVIAYGTRSSALVLGPRFVLVAQIGDGDVVSAARRRAGRRRRSLRTRASTGTTRPACASPARPPRSGSRRIDAEGGGGAGILLAHRRVRQRPVGRPVAAGGRRGPRRMLDRARPGGSADRLPTWTEQCASAEGSGDDTTVALRWRRSDPSCPRPATSSPWPGAAPP